MSHQTQHGKVHRRPQKRLVVIASCSRTSQSPLALGAGNPNEVGRQRVLWICGCGVHTSMGSPRPVPVPCISSTLTSLASTFPLVMAALMTCCCDGPLGACTTPPTVCATVFARASVPSRRSAAAGCCQSGLAPATSAVTGTMHPVHLADTSGRDPGPPWAPFVQLHGLQEQQAALTVRELERPSWLTAVPSRTMA